MLANLKNRIRGLLIWSQRYTGTDMVYLSKGGFWLILHQVIGTGGGLVLSIAYARLLEKDTFGTLSFVTSIASLISFFALSGIQTTLMRSVAQGNEGELQRAIITKLKWGILVAVISLGAALYYYTQGNLLLGSSFIIIAALLPLSETGRIYASFLTGKKMFKKNTEFALYNKIAFIVALVVAMLFTQKIAYLLLAYFIPITILHFIWLLISIRRYQLNKNIDPETQSYARHLTITDILGAINDQIDNILIFHYLGAAQLAIYRFALVPVIHGRAVIKSIGPLSFPKFANRPYREIYPAIKKRLFAFAAVIVGGSLFYIAVAPWIYNILFPNYNDSVLLSQFLAITLIGTVAIIPNTIWRAKKEIKTIYAFTITTTILRIGLLVVLVPLFGLWGAIWVRMGQYLIGGSIVIWYFFYAKNRFIANDESASEQIQ